MAHPAAVTCGSTVVFQNGGANRVWDIQGASSANGTPIQMYHTNNSAGRGRNRMSTAASSADKSVHLVPAEPILDDTGRVDLTGWVMREGIVAHASGRVLVIAGTGSRCHTSCPASRRYASHINSPMTGAKTA
jgi:hypothetical protein